ncbi:MAG: hypothetical protein ACRD9S_03130 [Pyrinomonadaceae bacterium]
MKTFKVICAATVLALSLSIPVYADDTNPGDSHNPGRPSSVSEIPNDEEKTESTTTDSDFSLSAVVDMLWTVASIF